MRTTIVAVATAVAAAGCGTAPGSSGSAEPAVAQLQAGAETQPSADDDANGVAVWLHPQDLSRSLVLGSAGTAGLELFSLDGERVGQLADAEIDHVAVTYGFERNETASALIVGYDRRSTGLMVFEIDPQSLQLEQVSSEPFPTGVEVTGLCTYRSPLTGRHYAFAATDDGQLQQWQLSPAGHKVQARLVRTVPVGIGSGYCAVNAAAGEVYVSEESVGIWKIPAEPESDAQRKPVDLVAPYGQLDEEVKGLAIYASPDGAGWLVASDIAASRFNVYALADGALVGRFTLGAAGNVDGVDDAEGLAIVSVAPTAAYEGGLLAVVDEANEPGSNIKLVAWNTIASALSLQSVGSDPRTPPAAAAKVVEPSVETEPVPDQGDAADDIAIWVHPREPARSLVIGTNKKRGLEVYNLQGRRVQVLDDGRMNNVDLRYGFELAGRPVALVAATNRTDKTLAIYKVDPDSGRLSYIVDGSIPTGLRDPYGLCMYRSASSGQYFVFANDGADGTFRQWRLFEQGGKVSAEAVRDFAVGSQAEGCAADDDTGHLFVGEEGAALWRYSAEPDGGSERTRVDAVGEGGHLVADIEGVAIYYGPDGTGYVIASSQGSDNYAVYERSGDNAFIGKFHVVANPALGIDGSSETDGLDVISTPLGQHFPYGVFIAQDGRNITPAERQNFKLVPWERIADALGLKKHTDWNPRQ